MQLAKFVNQYIGLARLRGLNPRNPVTFQFTPNPALPDVYKILVSHTEPSFSEIPYNVIWIDAAPVSPTYMQVKLRTSHITDGTNRSSWSRITDYTKLFASRQFYRFVVENASDLGITVGDIDVPNASTSRIGTVILDDVFLDPSVDALVVGDNDPRMADNRDPLEHTHDDFPRTMIRLNSSAYVEVSSSNAPEAGMVLAIVDLDSKNPNKYIGRWVKPTIDNIEWQSPRLLNLRISLPGNASYMEEKSTVQLEATAEWENRVVHMPEGIVWSIEENVFGVTIDQNGAVTAPDIEDDVNLVVTAKKLDPVYGVWVEATYLLRIKNITQAMDPIVSLSIVGKDTLIYGDTDTYSVILMRESGASTVVIPTTFTSEDEALSLTGLIGRAGRVDTDLPVVLTAKYFFDGVTYQGLKTVTVLAENIESLTIIGPTEFEPDQVHSYQFQATWTSGKVGFITPDTFTSTPASVVDILENTVTALRHEDQHNAVLTATYTEYGKEVTGTLPIVIAAFVAPVVLVSIKISGPNTLEEHKSGSYLVTATYSDSTTKTVLANSFTSNTPVLTTVGQTTTAGEVTQDVDAILRASYTEKGVTVEDEFPLRILNVIPVTTLVSIAINGPTAVQHETTQSYTVIATYSDGSTVEVVPTEFKIAGTDAYSVLAGQDLTIGTVDKLSHTINLSATYIEKGVTRNATLPVVVTGVEVVTITSVEIVGPAQIEELKSGTYTARVIYSNGTTLDPAAAEWEIVQGTTYATVDQNGNLFANEVTQDRVVMIRATVDGKYVDKSVTIKNVIVVVPTGIQIIAPLQVTEGNEALLAGRLLLSDASNRVLTASEIVSWTIVPSTTFATLDATGKLVVLDILEKDETINVELKAMVDGKPYSANQEIILKNVVDSPQNGLIEGPTTAPEGTEVNYTAMVVLLSGAKVVPDSVTGWKISVGGANGTITNQGKLTLKNVNANLTIRITCIATYKGVAYEPILDIIITNTGDHPLSAALIGASTVLEGESALYELELTLESGTKVKVQPVLARISGTAATVTGNTLYGNFVTADGTVVIEGTATYGGLEYSAQKSVLVKDVTILLTGLAIQGPASFDSGTSADYSAVATMSDASTPVVTQESTWSIVSNGGLTGLTLDKGVLTAPKTTTDVNVTIRAVYSEGGVTKTADMVIAIKAEEAVAGYGPRYGVATKVTSAAQYNAAFMALLTGVMTETGEQTVTIEGGTSTFAANTYAYTAWPARLGYGYFVDYSTGSAGFVGSWDGGQEFDDFNFGDPARVMIEGEEYIIYRNDFPFEQNKMVFKVNLGATNPASGAP